MYNDRSLKTAASALCLVLLPALAHALPPVANAGVPQSVNEGFPVSLDGTGSTDDGMIVAFQWTQLSGAVAALTLANTATPFFVAPAVPPGGDTLTFQLTVTDDTGAMDSATVDVTVNDVNSPPNANAGTNLAVNEGDPVTLDGSASADTDSDGLGAIAGFAWTQTGGPAVTLTGANGATPSFIAPTSVPAGGTLTLTFSLTVTDNAGAMSSADSVTVTIRDVNQPPAANAGGNQMVAEGDAVMLDGSASLETDLGDAIATFAWVQTGGPAVTLNNAASATPDFIAPAVGANGATLTFELTVTDTLGASGTDTVDVEVSDVNVGPTASAGPGQSVTEGDLVTLDGSASSDGDPDGLGGIASFSWTQVAGPAVTLSDPSSPQPTFTAPAVGVMGDVLTFSLTVVDTAGASGDDLVDIVLADANVPPVAAAGPDQVVNEGDLVVLNGGNSVDGDPDGLGMLASFAWSQVAGTTVDLMGAGTATPTFVAPSVGVAGGALEFELTVTDNAGAVDTDRVIVNVGDVNKPPLADAGPPSQTVSEGDPVTLDASNSVDPDDPLGSIVSYLWQQDPGDAQQVVLSDATAVRPTFAAPAVGAGGAALNFTVTVTDDAGGMDSDATIVNVTNINQPPVAVAGADQNVSEGALVTLDGSNSFDPDAPIAAFAWAQSGTSGFSVMLSDPAAAQPTFVAPEVDAAGTSLEFTLTVTGDAGLMDTDTVVVNVSDQLIAPIADAGADVSIGEGALVELDGTASSDPDGLISAFQWRQISGPPVTLSGANSPTPSFAAPSVGPQGENFGFELTVTDNDALVATDTVVVTVVNVNLPPVALPSVPIEAVEGTTVVLDAGASSDPDGSVAAVQWTQVDGPPVSFADPAGQITTFVAPAVTDGAVVTLALTVTDDGGLQNSSEFQIQIIENGIAGFDASEVVLQASTGDALGLTSDDRGDLVSVEVVDPATIAEQENRPTSFPIGLLRFVVRVQSAGASSTVVVDLDQPAPEDATWVKFSPTGGWTDFGANAAFNADRTQVTLTLVDGGAGDDDGLANGLIQDPSGLGVLPQGSGGPGGASSGGGGGGGCAVADSRHADLLLLLLGCASLYGVWLRRPQRSTAGANQADAL